MHIRLAHVYLRQLQKTTMGSTAFKITNSVIHGSSNNRIGKDRTSFGGLREDQRSFERTNSSSDIWMVVQKPTGMESAFSQRLQFQIICKMVASALLALCSDHYLPQGGITTHP